MRLLLMAIIMLLSYYQPAFSGEVIPGPYKAKILEVVDGDTVKARIHVWLDHHIETTVRLEGIDTPELRARCDLEAQKAADAKSYLQKILDEQVVTLHDIQYGKYAGRVVARITMESGQVPSDMLLSEGLATFYDGKKRKDWCHSA